MCDRRYPDHPKYLSAGLHRKTGWQALGPPTHGKVAESHNSNRPNESENRTLNSSPVWAENCHANIGCVSWSNVRVSNPSGAPHSFIHTLSLGVDLNSHCNGWPIGDSVFSLMHLVPFIVLCKILRIRFTAFTPSN